MTVSAECIREAVVALAGIEGLYMDADSLVEDVVLLARAFPEQDDFMAACVNTRRAIVQLVEGLVTPSHLKYEFEGWQSYHYQQRVAQGTRATLRILFRAIDGGIEVKGFGHRHVPSDFYARMAAARADEG